MKILFIITGLGCGGAEHQVTLLADRMHARGYEVRIISLTGGSVIKPQENSIKINELNMRKSPLGVLTALLKCKKIIEKFAPDVVHSHMVHANLFTRILRVFCKIPRLICTAHSTNEGDGLRMALYRITDKLCNLSTNVSQSAVTRYIALKAAPAHRIIPVYNAIDTEKYRFNQSIRDKIRIKNGVSGPLMLAVGRLTEAKDYPTLLRAFSLVRGNIANAELWIAGDGHLRNELISLADSLGLTSSIKFLGLRRDIEQLMCAADVFVLSSEWEGFGLVVAEAMACERTVVTTDCGGVREVIGTHGHIVQPKSLEKLADALFLAIQNCDKPNTAGRIHIENCFSINKIVPMWEQIYSNGRPLKNELMTV